MSWLGLIVAGVIIGLLARLVLPGSQPIGLVLTVLTGIVGTLAGWWLAGALGVGQTRGIDWFRWAISIVVAVVLVAVVAAARRSAARH